MAAASAQGITSEKLSDIKATRKALPVTETMLQRATNAVSLLQPKKSEYTRVPLGQSSQSVYSAVVANGNPDPVSAQVRLRIFDGAMTEVASASSAPVLLAAGSNSAPLAVVPAFNPTATGTYTFTYDAVIDGTPEAGSESSYTVEYTIAQMARDVSTPTGGLGIGAGDGGYLGHAFTYSSATTLASVDIYQLGATSSGFEMGCAIFKLVGGVPQLVYTAPSQQMVVGTAPGWVTYAVSPALTVNAGDTLVICAQEFAQVIRVGLTTNIFTTGATYVNWPSIPGGGWLHNEDFGGSFNKSYMIRPNLSCTLPDPAAPALQVFCDGATVNDLSASGSNIAWYEEAAGGAALAAGTVLTTDTYYVSQTDGSCSSNRVPVAVTITPLTSNTTTIDACDSYFWAETGTTYTTSGTYTSVTDCHTETLELTITPSTVNTTVITACDSYTWPVTGLTYTTTGDWNVTTGCHTEVLDLTITPSTLNTTVISACDSYTWPVTGLTYTDSGDWNVTTGCHTEVLELTITPSTLNTTVITACDSYTWPVTGLTYTDSGDWNVTTGCHTEVLELTITPSTLNTTVISACDSYTWPVTGLTYTESGDWNVTTGCHTEVLELTITPATTNITAISACDSYTWDANGITYTESGMYEIVTGCHTAALELTITPSTSHLTQANVCGSYTWDQNNVTYTESGVYEVVNGCHTEVLELTIVPITSNTTVIEACDSYYWNQTEVTYTESGTYQLVNGCNTETLELTITPSTSNITPMTACDSYTWDTNGVTYTESGMYEVVTGCHTEMLELTITPATVSDLSVSACDSFTWDANGVTYTESGVYTAVNGCHTDIMELNLNASPVITVQPVSTSVAEGSDVVFSIMADNAGDYQWQVSVDEGQSWMNLPEGGDITGSNSSSLNISGLLITPDADGAQFRAIVTNGICEAISVPATLSIMLGIDPINTGSIALYPNPTHDRVHVDTKNAAATVTVFDINGRLMHTQQLVNGSGDIDLTGVQSGVYLFRVATENGTINKKVVKQ
ncbi:hypothetical protein HYN48_09555 [Flavobacterium magnum]|uniref:Secretion system C-terminal sorting domain-containing protein n=2 Tax=Flavobacterium magnum TaxID=2162713 RepID=A0A2S0RG88_9FLAO|nr:hypothetical protein HYN48_09555 [Flavobacterium magnum]